MEIHTSAGKIIPLVFKTAALALGVAAIVLTVLQVVSAETQVVLLGAGLFALAITSLK